MAKRTDSELIEIVTKLREDYQVEAVQAAEIEIRKRNLSAEQIESAREEIKAKEAVLSGRENEPLASGQKLLFFIFFWGVFPWAMAGTYKAEGYTRKYNEAWQFMRYGLMSLLGFMLLMFLIEYLTT